MAYFLSVIHWTNDAGNNTIVGLFDDIDLATAQTREYFESVQGVASTQMIADLVTQPEELLHRVISWNGDLNQDMQMREPGSSADIYEMPINGIYPGSLINELDHEGVVLPEG